MLETFIRRTPLFSGLPDREVSYLALTLHRMNYAVGTLPASQPGPIWVNTGLRIKNRESRI